MCVQLDALLIIPPSSIVSAQVGVLGFTQSSAPHYLHTGLAGPQDPPSGCRGAVSGGHDRDGFGAAGLAGRNHRRGRAART